MSRCSDMRMTSEHFRNLTLPPQNTSNETAIGIYIFEKKMSTIDCRTPISYDCRPIAASYSVNITQFSFQVTLTDLPGSSSAKSTITTLPNQPPTAGTPLPSTTSNTHTHIGENTSKEEEKKSITGVVMGSVVGAVAFVLFVIIAIGYC
ncbi:uncharacterized protein [Argopecten irradians]|uniref:uncharacterized protein n=1 Tax=Argopecten irradians TaxID=31199 RepID=UPI00371AD254